MAPSILWTSTIPIVAALIAFIGVALTLILHWRNNNKQLMSSHALKLAEMRQAWINNLRDAMSVFQSYAVTPNVDQANTRELYEHGTRIELMMNSNDPEYKALTDSMYKFLAATTQSEKYAANPDFVAVCQKILKSEWDRLRGDLEKAAR